MRKIYYLPVIVFLLAFSSAYSQNLDWGYKIGGTYTDRAFDIVKDAAGNIYLTGGISNTVDMNPAGTPYPVNTLGVNSSDVFIARYNKNFVLQWAFNLGTSAWEAGAKILVDDSLNVYLMGECFGNCDFGPFIKL
jgi:hypothetical protein